MRKDYRAGIRFNESTAAELKEIMKKGGYTKRSKAIRDVITYYYQKKIVPEKSISDKDYGLKHDVTVSVDEESMLESIVNGGHALNKDDAIRTAIREYNKSEELKKKFESMQKGTETAAVIAVTLASIARNPSPTISHVYIGNVEIPLGKYQELLHQC